MRIVFFSLLAMSLAAPVYADGDKKWQGPYGGVAVGGSFAEVAPDNQAILSTFFIANAGGDDKE